MADVELIKVTKRYGSVVACSEVDFHINDGEFVTLLGPSGCGKTTALNLIAGLDEVTSGQILMDGAVVNGLTPFERDVAMCSRSALSAYDGRRQHRVHPQAPETAEGRGPQAGGRRG
jgi:ABC-type sugar transport systems, ATPase components